jgi:hypothetical protein
VNTAYIINFIRDAVISTLPTISGAQGGRYEKRKRKKEEVKRLKGLEMELQAALDGIGREGGILKC